MAADNYSISDLAREFGVTTRTLRFYEEKGLLSPVRSGNSRVYSCTDRVRLKLILRGKRLGFSLDESRDIITMYEPTTGNLRQLESLLAKIQEKRTVLEQRRKEIDSMLKDLRQTESMCLEALPKRSRKVAGRTGS